MTKRHWITTKEAKEMYNIGVNQLNKLVAHNVLTMKKEEYTGRGRNRNVYNHAQIRNYGNMTRGERRTYMSKLNGTKLGPRVKKNKTVTKPAYPKNELFVTTSNHDKTHDNFWENLVNQPKHYNPGTIPVIDAIDDWNLGFSAGTVIKYIVRA